MLPSPEYSHPHGRLGVQCQQKVVLCSTDCTHPKEKTSCPPKKIQRLEIKKIQRLEILFIWTT